ncbi:hypothetical protein OAQ34_05060 [Opitutales bacterium]|nr:hypothetical protein [Opitutales bacterium]
MAESVRGIVFESGIVPLADSDFFEVHSSDRISRLGRKLSSYLFPSSKHCFDLVSSGLIVDLIGSYFGRQPYLRNFPMLLNTEFEKKEETDVQEHFHLDGGTRQVSCIFLIDDLDEEMTCTEYASRSHREFLPISHYLDRWKIDNAEIESKYEIVHLCGKAGDLVVFDAGNGYHRGKFVPMTSRKMIHLNYTQGNRIVQGHSDEYLADRLSGHSRRVVESLKFLS